MTDADFIHSQYENMTIEPPPASIVGWIEARRVLPPDSPIPGYYSFARTPFQKEWVENMRPYSPIVNTIIMKSRKVGATTAVEGVVGFWMSAWPTSIIYCTATEALAKSWATENIMHVIESCGLQEKLIAPFSNARNKRNAITTKKIEFIGGRLEIISSGSTDARRAKNARIIILDEVDGLPEMTQQEGSYIEILKGHSASWGARRKFCAFSSPTTLEASAIHKLYSAYDERKFLIPCPVCGRDIELVDAGNGANYGLKADMKAGRLIDVYYLCPYCGDIFHNKDKTIFFSERPHCKKEPHKVLQPAHWEATKQIDDQYSRSYSINSLYSPLGALTFRDVYEAKLKAQEGGGDGLRSYVNLYLGQPYKDTGQRPSINKVIELRGEYASGEVPKEVIFLTAAVDVQRGSATDEKNPPRLEMEIMGSCPGKQSYSVLYKVFDGAIDDPYSGAWAKLRQFEEEGGLQFTRADGCLFYVALMGIDSGYLPDVVYRFCESQPYTLPVKGFWLLRADDKRKEKGDIPGGLRRYRAARIGTSGVKLLEINTNHYKDHIYNRLKIERQVSTEQRPGYCGFPRDYADEYFLQLCGEEKRTDGSFKPIRERTEALDVRVYNEALSDYFLEMQVQAYRAWYTSQKKWSQQGLNHIDKIFMISELIRHPGRRLEFSIN
jgi:phage terminase large subunit GpA-like protein